MVSCQNLKSIEFDHLEQVPDKMKIHTESI